MRELLEQIDRIRHYIRGGRSRRRPSPVSLRHMIAVSCPQEGFCVATGGAVSKFEAGSWTTEVSISKENLPMVSCTSTSFCAALSVHGASYIYNGTSWSPAKLRTKRGDQWHSISCASTASRSATASRPRPSTEAAEASPRRYRTWIATSTVEQRTSAPGSGTRRSDVWHRTVSPPVARRGPPHARARPFARCAKRSRRARRRHGRPKPGALS